MADDTTPPTLTITRIGGEFAEVGAPVRFALTFSEPVTGVTAAALRLNASATLKGTTITSVTGSGADYVVTVGPATAGYGAVTLDVTAAGIADLAGNALRPPTTFVSSPEVTQNGPVLASVTADVNGDGRADVVLARGDSQVNIYLANADGSLSGAIPQGNEFNASGINTSVAVGDMNGDGLADIIVGNSSRLVYFLPGQGNGVFGAAVSAAIGSGQPTSLTIGDVNGDGKPDVLTNNSSLPTLSLLRGVGNGTFAAFTTIDIGSPARQVLLADMTGDGKLDIVALRENATLAVLAGNGDGSFAAAREITLAYPSFILAVSDVDGDGQKDMVVSDAEDKRIIAYVNNGDGTFAPKKSASLGLLVAVADMNGDGKPDAVTTSFKDGTRTHRVLYGQGDGTFLGEVFLAFSDQTIELAAVADFNGDGQQDLAMRRFFTGSGFATLLARPGTSQAGPTTTIDDYAGDASTSGRIAPGQSVAGYISNSQDRDWFRTDLVAGQTYVFDLQGYPSGNGSHLLTFLVLLDGTGVAILSDQGSGDLGEARLTFTASISGAYFLQVPRTGGWSVGSYQLTETRIATMQADFSEGADIVTLRSPIAAVPVQVWSARGGDDDVTGGKATSDTIYGNAGNDTLSGGDVGLTLAGAGIFHAYQLFGRMPDPAGFEYMVKIAGRFVGDVQSLFATSSAEFTAIYGGLNNGDFIAKLYTTALGRAPSATEVVSWELRISDFASRSTVVTEFLGLPELQERTEFTQVEFAASLDKANFGALHRLYATAFGRAPELGGFSDWTGRRDAGQTIGDVAQGFANSDEFGAATKDLTNAQIVTKLYQNALGRAPDAGGLADWVSQLDAGPKTGALLAKVLLGFSESAEFKALQPTAPAAFVSNVLTQWSDVLDGGSGDDVLIGGRGADTFRFLKGETGSDRIIAFESWDKLAFTNFGYASGADALGHMAQLGADVVFSDQGSSITFVNTTLATVSAANLIVGEIL